MKRWGVFVLVVLLAGGALWMSQRREATAEVGPGAILHFIADTEREVSRLPFQLTRLSDAEEIRIGDELAGRYGTYPERPGAADFAQIQAYVQRVGAQVAARAHRQLPFRFHYVAQPGFVNAFALPGGHVYFGQGLLALMDSEDQLAAVLGHESAHIDRYHCAERVQTEARLRKLQLGIVGAVLQIPLAVFQAGYTKNQELEADRVGLELAARAGYSPMGMIRLFEKMQAMDRRPARAPETPQEEAAQVVFQTMGGYFRSHPYPAERIVEMRRLIAQNGWESRTAEKPLAVWALLHPEKHATPAAAKE